MYQATNITDARRGYEDDGIGGWVAPDGVFFQAHYTDHYAVAVEIIKGYLRTDLGYGFSDYLIDLGWIRLETDGRINHSYNPTSAQLDVLYRLYTIGGGSFYKDYMYHHIKPVLESTCMREPMQRVPSQGDQENYRRVYA